MEFALIGVVAVVTIVAVAAFAKQLGIASPLVLVVVGIGFSFIPGVPLPFTVPSWVILSAVLPPLLYSAAVQVPVIDLRRNLASISLLSVILVIATSVGVGFLLFSMLHDLDLGAAIAVGAIVSPTDAVAATSVAKRLGLPARLVTMLEGEGLVNDASALVLLKVAIGATGAGISLWNVAGSFAFSVAAAIVLGLLVGFVTVWARARLKDSVLDTAISFAVPFIAYIPAEEIGASGVLAVVVAGIYSGHRAASSFSAQTRLSERLNWRTVQFLLENGVFLLMGLQLRTIVGNVPHDEFGLLQSVVIGLLLCIVLLAIRIVFVAPLEWRMARTQKHDSDPGSWKKGAAVLSWAGMRGVVTVAAAQSLPDDTRYRPQLIVIAFTVAVVTLLLQGGTLPWLIRRLGIRGSDVAADRRSLATLIDEMSESGLAALETEIPENDGEKADPEVIERVKQDTLLRGAAAWERAERAEQDDPESGPHHQYRALRSRVIAAERDALLEARSRGDYPSRVLQRAQELLDAEEARLAQGFGSA